MAQYVINHLFPHDPAIASYRYRVVIPGVELHKRGHSVLMNDMPEEGAINVYHKHWRREKMRDYMERYPGIMDVTDDHFAGERELSEHYRAMVKMANRVTCSSSAMRKVIEEETGKDAFVISDPFEFPEIPPRPIAAKKMLWFGHPLNLMALEGIELDCPITIVTRGELPPNPNVTYVPYSRGQLMETAAEHDTCIIPFQDTRKDRCKSANRAINALRLGLFVSANPIPSYRDLEPYIYLSDNVMEGVRWARQNPVEAMDMIRAGQAYIETHYSPEVVADGWQSVCASM